MWNINFVIFKFNKYDNFSLETFAQDLHNKRWCTYSFYCTVPMLPYSRGYTRNILFDTLCHNYIAKFTALNAYFGGYFLWYPPRKFMSNFIFSWRIYISSNRCNVYSNCFFCERIILIVLQRLPRNGAFIVVAQSMTLMNLQGNK